MNRASTGLAIVVAIALAATPDPGGAQEEAEDARELGWFYSAELTFVLTGGNAESSTFGVGAGLQRVWERSELLLRAGGLRTESSRTTRTAVGTPADFEVVEQSESRVTAEDYFARGRYDHQISSSIFLFGGAGWERNTFAGFDGRVSFVSGAGKIWFERERAHFKTDLGITVTMQDDVVEAEPGDDSETFAGLRASWDYRRPITSTTEFESLLVVDDSLVDTEDLRADFTNSLLVEISEILGLRTGLQLRWDNRPSLVASPLEQPLGTPTGQSVLVPLDELDTIFTVALVASF